LRGSGPALSESDPPLRGPSPPLGEPSPSLRERSSPLREWNPSLPGSSPPLGEPSPSLREPSPLLAVARIGADVERIRSAAPWVESAAPGVESVAWGIESVAQGVESVARRFLRIRFARSFRRRCGVAGVVWNAGTCHRFWGRGLVRAAACERGGNPRRCDKSPPAAKLRPVAALQMRAALRLLISPN
jgi:hypothetical protein